MKHPAPATSVAGYPSDWIFDIALKDGSTVRIRPILPTDGPLLEGMWDALSKQSRFYRFFQVKERLEPEEIVRFTVLDYRERMAFVAVEEGEIIAVGRYEMREGRTTEAEVAFAVTDVNQGRGLGTRLLLLLTDYARQQGIESFFAFVLPENLAMMRVFRNAGFELERRLEEGLYDVRFPTAESTETVAVREEHERRSIAASILPIFYPRSIAVIGASRNPESIGGRLFANLVTSGFAGPVYPVNPSTPVIKSIRTHASVKDIDDHVDLAFIVVPSQYVLDVVAECAEKDVKGVVVISAGFSETGEEGTALEGELLELVRSAGMRMVGPNCMGVINTDLAVTMNGQFGPQFPPHGNVAMSSQSGALGIAILDYAARLNIGISSFVSVGNKADVSGNDLLLYWEDDPSTDVILLYLEDFGNPRRFSRIARRIGRRKPIVAVKSGRTAGGARAASSHTGSLASLDVAVDALFRQAGVIRTDTLQELFDVTSLLANQPLPKGRRIGVVTNAGGPGILAVDALEAEGLVVAEFSTELQQRLRGHLSPDASVRNPIDMIASAGPAQYVACLEELLASDEVDVVMAIFIPASPTGVAETAAAIARVAREHESDTTFVAVYMSAEGAHKELTTGSVHVPTYPFPEQAAMALSRAVRHAEWRGRDEGKRVRFDDTDLAGARDVVARAVDRMGDEGGWLEPEEVDAVLAAVGLRTPRSAVVASAAEAVALGEEWGGSLVLKVISPSALHKSDVGGVALDVTGAADIEAAYAAVTAAVPDPEGVLVQEFVAGGHEVLIGMTEDPNFGPLIVFGLGGVFVELIGDVAFRINPVTDVDAREMIAEVKSARLLDGYRGGPAGDIDAVAEAILRISMLVDEVPEIAEMDLNPVKVAEPGHGVSVVDGRMRVRPVQGSWLPSRRDIIATV
jgi:acetyl coenzyme A synthetase (ADP forming)-like protein